jgi:hypothetical protein
MKYVMYSLCHERDSDGYRNTHQNAITSQMECCLKKRYNWNIFLKGALPHLTA